MTLDFGVGAQVVVRAATVADRAPWPGDPSGIIVAAAGSTIGAVWGKAAGRMWLIQFDEPQADPGGESRSSAQVHEKYLELAPPVGEHSEP